MEAADGTVIAVDLGGTTIKAAVIDAAGRTRHELTRSTPAEHGPEAVVREVEAVVRELAAPAAFAGPAAQAVAVVVPGIVDAAAGRAEFSANLGFRGLPLRDRIESAAGLPTALGHDVGAAGVAEMTVGITQGVGDYLLAVIGTGISGVIRAAGQPVRGACGMAGELGHVPVAPGGRPCPCGQRGCLERYAAAPAIARRYAELGGEAGVSAREVAARRDSDPAADAAWHEAVEALAIAFTTCTMLLDPELIVLAGGLSDAGDGLAEPVRAELAARVTWREPPAVRLSPLRGRAGLVGAAVLAWRLLGIDPAGRWSPAA